MFYRSLSLTGFGPHTTTAEYTFPNGVIVITGPNGSGKTTIIDAISWAIHGPRAALRSVKDRTSVINKNSQTAKVTLKVDRGEDTLVITRSLTRSGGHTLKVRVNGNLTDAGITASQEVINEFFGSVNASVFTHVSTLSSAPSQPVNPFISSEDTARRKFLGELVDPAGDFEHTNKSVRNRLREDKKTRTLLEGRLDGLRDNAPEEPNLDRLSEVEQEIVDHERARRQHEQRMSAARSRDDVQVAGLIATHRSESESLDTRISELRLTQNRVNTEINETEDILVETAKSIVALSRKRDKAITRVEELDTEIDACDTRIAHHHETIRVITQRRDTLRSQMMANQQLLDMSKTSGDSCVLCGSDITDSSHDHMDSLQDSIRDLSGKVASFDEDIQESENIISKIRDHRKRLSQRREKIDPNKISDRIEDLRDLVDREEDNQTDRIKREKVIIRDLERLAETKAEHDRMVDQLSGEIDPKVLQGQDQMNETWSFISDSLADLHAERTRIEDNVSAWDAFQAKVTQVETDLHWTNKIIDQLEILKDQTSPTGVISTMIADVAESISVSAQAHLEQTFHREADVEIISSVAEGDATCRITVDGRDLSTHSHGEQSRFIAAILIALAEVTEDVTGHWIPLLWDEPTMASDMGITEDFVDMVAGDEKRQVFLLTRDEYPVDYVDRSVVLERA